MSEPWADPLNYVAPPAFAPPEARTAPIDPYGPQRFGYSVGALTPRASGYRSPYGYPPPRRRSPAAIAITALISAVLLAAVLVGIASASSADQRSLSLPLQVGDYFQVRALTGPEISTAFGGSTGALSGLDAQALDTAKVAAYGVQGSQVVSLVFIGFAGKDNAEIATELRQQASDSVVAAVFEGAGGPATKSEFPGILGGALACGQVSQDGDIVSVGVWADRSTLGVVLLLGQVDATQTGVITRQFRSAAER